MLFIRRSCFTVHPIPVTGQSRAAHYLLLPRHAIYQPVDGHIANIYMFTLTSLGSAQLVEAVIGILNSPSSTPRSLLYRNIMLGDITLI